MNIFTCKCIWIYLHRYTYIWCMFNDSKDSGFNIFTTKRVQFDWTGFSRVSMFKLMILGWFKTVSCFIASMVLGCLPTWYEWWMDDLLFGVYKRRFIPQMGIPPKSSTITVRPFWYWKAMGLGILQILHFKIPPNLVNIPGVTRPAMRRAYWNDLMFTSPLCSLMTSFAGERTPDSAHCSQVIGLSKWMVTDIDRSTDFSIISGKIQKWLPDQGILGNADITPHNRWYRCLFPMGSCDGVEISPHDQSKTWPEECVQALNEIHAAQSREDLSAEAKLNQLVRELDPLDLSRVCCAPDYLDEF